MVVSVKLGVFHTGANQVPLVNGCLPLMEDNGRVLSIESFFCTHPLNIIMLRLQHVVQTQEKIQLNYYITLFT